jgi:hypothetical protein
VIPAILSIAQSLLGLCGPVDDCTLSSGRSPYLRCIFKCTARVYVDECQTLVTERAFRSKLTQLKRVSLPVAWIFLTAPTSIRTSFGSLGRLPASMSTLGTLRSMGPTSNYRFRIGAGMRDMIEMRDGK